MLKKISIVVGTRPNFIKITQFKKVVKNCFHDFAEIKIIHTGQHYDEEMANVFFKQFNITPDYALNLKSILPAERIGEMILGLTQYFHSNRPDLILTVGDVDSTLAASLTANKSGIQQGHIESGLRSFDLKMPEEINRIITDRVSDFHFTTEKNALKNLADENINTKNVFFSGNTMIDTLINYQDLIDQNNILIENSINNCEYVVGTFHRPSNVDSIKNLRQIVNIIRKISTSTTIVIPIHPRTLRKLTESGLINDLKSKQIILTGPLDYFGFHKLIKNSIGVITDSGGIQEETTYYKVPCITLRENTERPITIEKGSNILCPDIFSDNLYIHLEAMLNKNWKTGEIPELWDGNATHRILNYIKQQL